jgi:hypothetical protein
MRYVRLRTFDNPLLPIPSAALVRGTRTALEVIAQGGGVYTHCSRRHRSVAMAAAILIARAIAQVGYDDQGTAGSGNPEAAHPARILEFARMARREQADPACRHHRGGLHIPQTKEGDLGDPLTVCRSHSPQLAIVTPRALIITCQTRRRTGFFAPTAQPRACDPSRVTMRTGNPAVGSPGIDPVR